MEDVNPPPLLRDVIDAHDDESHDAAFHRLSAAVASEPDHWWETMKRLIDATEADPVDAEELAAPIVEALFELGGHWPSRIRDDAHRDKRLPPILLWALDEKVLDLFSVELVVRAWLRYQETEDPWDLWALSPGYEDWPSNQAWSFVRACAEGASDEVLPMVGVSIVEDLLRVHGESAVDDLVRHAADSSRVRDALNEIWWWHMISDESARRIEAETGARLIWRTT